MFAVKLYVYDLSNGLAKSMSLQLTGKQIDGIWHTSVVVYGKEVFYGGQGIEITSPGGSHHGRPLRIEDMGETDIDQDTFEEYLNQMRDHYLGTKYHLLEFNCNSFTNDCVGFLTGGEIPSYVKDLPTEFLSTPFGAALRPTIDSMFGANGPTPTARPRQASTSDSILQSVAARASGSRPSVSSTPPLTNGTSVLTAPIQIATNPATLQSIISRHKAVAVFFTSTTCPPCKVIEPTFEDLAYAKASAGVAFVKVDLGVGMGSAAASEYNVTATPTFVCLNDGVKTSQVTGANVSDLRSSVDLMIFQAFPPHPHTKLELPALRGISLQPILYKQKPNLQAASAKLESFLGTNQIKNRDVLKGSLIRWLETYDNGYPKPPSRQDLSKWCIFSESIAQLLEADKLFPLFDLWRMALLDPRIGLELSQGTQPFETFLDKARSSLESPSAESKNSRNTLVTLLRLLSNAFVNTELSDVLLLRQLRPSVTAMVVPCLLHADSAIRSAAAGVAFNTAARYQAARVSYYRDGKPGDAVPEMLGDDDWEMELITALLEALSQETETEEVVHRLTAAFALTVYLSPRYDEEVRPLLEVLQAKDTLYAKLDQRLFGGKGIVKKEVRRLVEEVSSKLCP